MYINAFYAEDPRRRASDEIDFGAAWTDDEGVVHQLSWVVDTGELFATFEWAGEGSLVLSIAESLLGEVPDTPGANQLRVEVLAIVATRDEVENALEGWRDVMPAKNSFAWIRERLSGLPGPSDVKEGER